MNLSANVSLEQFTRSQTATRNNISEQFDPPQDVLASAKDLCENVIERLHILFPDLFISSGYRCRKLNTSIGGSNSSQHCFGQAANLGVNKVSNIEIAKAMISAKIPYDQMIVEFGTMEKPAWIHVSYKHGGNRYEILRAETKDGKTVYSKLRMEDILTIKTT
jgi:zinc D-Ala-D-Ala carboxypeptidase